jgi:hypothetical protein
VGPRTSALVICTSSWHGHFALHSALTMSHRRHFTQVADIGKPFFSQPHATLSHPASPSDTFSTSRTLSASPAPALLVPTEPLSRHSTHWFSLLTTSDPESSTSALPDKDYLTGDHS